MSALVIGVDPGPIPGFVRLEVAHGRIVRTDIMQCTHLLAPDVLRLLLAEHSGARLVAIERFVVGNRAGRSAGAVAGEITRSMIGALEREASQHQGASVVLRSASEVKPWATDDRLARVRLLEPTKTMRHARDAGRHALYAAVRGHLIPDPLSKETPR